MTVQRFHRIKSPGNMLMDEINYLGTPGKGLISLKTGNVILKVCPQCFAENLPYSIDQSVCAWCGFAATTDQNIETSSGYF